MTILDLIRFPIEKFFSELIRKRPLLKVVGNPKSPYSADLPVQHEIIEFDEEGKGRQHIFWLKVKNKGDATAEDCHGIFSFLDRRGEPLGHLRHRVENWRSGFAFSPPLKEPISLHPGEEIYLGIHLPFNHLNNPTKEALSEYEFPVAVKIEAAAKDAKLQLLAILEFGVVPANAMLAPKLTYRSWLWQRKWQFYWWFGRLWRTIKSEP